jgi:hypothetical protein
MNYETHRARAFRVPHACAIRLLDSGVRGGFLQGAKPFNKSAEKIRLSVAPASLESQALMTI